MIRNNKFQLVLCGFNILFWELFLIRWQASSIRIVAYYTNFVLISAFFGLGVGTLLSRFTTRPSWLLHPFLTLCILSSPLLGRFTHLNLPTPHEYIWFGQPAGLVADAGMGAGPLLPSILILSAVYIQTAAVFAIFGQWLGILFRSTSSLKAYSFEIGGSILGILMFALLSFLQLPPLSLVVVGLVSLFLMVEMHWKTTGLAVAASLIMVIGVAEISRHFIWSPYYKIRFEPIKRIENPVTGHQTNFEQPIGYGVTVNNDYHQMMLDLRPRPEEHAFFTSWRNFYEAPYRTDRELPAGPILVVGSGTGNDVMAALRRTQRDIVAVEIDPVIAKLGKKYHAEKPYDSPRVTLVIDDARSYFQTTKIKFAMVVFGFLDSHTLMSTVSSIRLDNFVYTVDSFRQVRSILLPGGQVSVTFASNREWMHVRFLAMLTAVFGNKTDVFMPDPTSYPNGFIYQNLNQEDRPAQLESDVNLPTDDWPFLYLFRRGIPPHYWGFLAVIIGLGFLPLVTLPRGQRSIRLPYFFMGAAFFLLETSNVVNLALLFGSTWMVNVLVFAGILVLIQVGNLTAASLQDNRGHLKFAFLGLAVSAVVAYTTSRAALLSLDSSILKGFLAVVVYLGPVYFAGLIFALLIRSEKNLYQAYGSNILGAVVGGACEYASMLLGFQFLLVLMAGFYLLTYLLLFRTRPHILRI